MLLLNKLAFNDFGSTRPLLERCQKFKHKILMVHRRFLLLLGQFCSDLYDDNHPFRRKWSHLDLLKSQLHATPMNISHRDNNYVDIESPVSNPYYISND